MTGIASQPATEAKPGTCGKAITTLGSLAAW